MAKGQKPGSSWQLTINPRRHSELRCATCPNLLSKLDQSQGCKRCLSCRAVKPGHPHAPRKPKPTETTSFWLGLTSAELQIEARKRHPSSLSGESMPDFQRNPN